MLETLVTASILAKEFLGPMRLILSQIMLLFASSTATAQGITTLLNQGDFVVREHETSDQDAFDRGMCVAEVMNDRDQALIIQGYQDDTFTIVIRDDSWRLSDNFVSVVIEIDNSKWTVQGRTYPSDNIVYLWFDDQALVPDVLINKVRVSGGSQMAITAENGNPIANFSLSGSSAAMPQFAECWARRQMNGAATSFAVQSNTLPSLLKLYDNNGVIYSVSVANAGITPDDTNGALVRSNNVAGDGHVSFAMFGDCSALSLRYGPGEWSQSEDKNHPWFSVNFTSESFVFPLMDTPQNLGLGCEIE